MHDVNRTVGDPSIVKIRPGVTNLGKRRRAIVRAALRTYVLVDPTKFRAPAFADVCRASEVTGIITSRGADPKTLAQWREAGLGVQVV